MLKLYSYLVDAKWLFFGMIGGAIGLYIRSHKVQRRDLIIESVGAGFMGVVVAMGASYAGLPNPATGFLVGISSLIGARATLTFIHEKLLAKFGGKNSSAGESKETDK